MLNIIGAYIYCLSVWSKTNSLIVFASQQRRATGDDYEDFSGFCAGCILPINNGREAKGESLVVDFESKHFIGTLFLRIKQVPPHGRNDRINQDDDENNQRDYFANKKRKFQAVVKGSFKTPLSLSRCMTGQLFERPAGPLPARWIVKSFIKFISILAPRKSFLFNSIQFKKYVLSLFSLCICIFSFFFFFLYNAYEIITNYNY